MCEHPRAKRICHANAALASGSTGPFEHSAEDHDGTKHEHNQGLHRHPVDTNSVIRR